MLIQASNKISGPVYSAKPYFSNKTQILSLAATDAFHEKSFGKDEAAFVMEVLQTEIDRIRTHKNAQKRKYLKSIRHLNHVHGVLPSSMFLKGLVRESPTAVAGGGFADIWIGRLDKQRVCIKVLRFFQQGSDRATLLKALSKEVLLWRQLNHPNILPFLGINTELFSPSFCIVSPWMSNGDIMSYARNRSLDLSTKLEHTIQIAEGLFYLHGLDPPVVHGDIKGANILISDDRHCCLADFGLSVLDTQSMNPAHTASVQGSLRWLAPEFINPTPMPVQGRLTSRDIYAFGCTVFEILTGQPPFLSP
ncbi:kinase-like protein [Gymnopus androsaceus JB14]|uniref:Kinase-like protein n=1 Tax=Gymnopus androsaceus JB14 TaxID=1447944 RepID=A0A6A4HFL2_9AGAR|nr:kinase-like protein [Gymnopus androsaceus JB14]